MYASRSGDTSEKGARKGIRRTRLIGDDRFFVLLKRIPCGGCSEALMRMNRLIGMNAE